MQRTFIFTYLGCAFIISIQKFAHISSSLHLASCRLPVVLFFDQPPPPPKKNTKKHTPRVFQPPVLQCPSCPTTTDTSPPRATTRLFHLDEFEHDSEIHQGEICNTTIIFLEVSFGLEVFFCVKTDLVFFFWGGLKKTGVSILCGFGKKGGRILGDTCLVGF